MFIQQPFRIRVTPKKDQAVGVTVEQLVRSHFQEKADQYENPVVRILRLDTMNATSVGTATQMDLFLSIEADTLTFFEEFKRSFLRFEETSDFVIEPI